MTVSLEEEDYYEASKVYTIRTAFFIGKIKGLEFSAIDVGDCYPHYFSKA